MVETDVTWKINGLDLDTALGGYLTSVTAWQSPVTVRRTPIVIPGVHGTKTRSAVVLDEAQVVIQIAWDEVTSQADLQERVSHATALLTQPTITLTRISGGLETSAAAELVSIAPDDFVPGRGAKLLAIFAIGGVFFRGPTVTSAEIPFATDLINAELTDLAGSTGQILDAVARVTGPRTNPYLTDPTTGTGLQWTGTVPAGQYLFMSAKPLSARLSANQTDWVSGGTDVSAALSWPAAGRLLLSPVVQSGTVRKVLISATGAAGSAASKLTIRAARSFL